jgi:hypothetical protein
LRIYFLAEARYQGELAKDGHWTGTTAWANKLKSEDRKRILELLKLPQTTGLAEWFLTEFEDNWPYQVATTDVYFARASDQNTVKQKAVYASSLWPTDVTVYAIAAVIGLPPLMRRLRRRRFGRS